MVYQQDLQKYIKLYVEKNHIPGCVYAISKNGRIVNIGAIGLSNIENDSKITIHTVFEIGSISRLFLIVCILLLAQRGYIDLYRSIADYIKDIPNNWRHITIINLLNHTSGIECVPNDFNWGEEIDKTIIYKLQINGSDETKFNEVNFFLLGNIIRTVTKKDYKTFLENNIFKPLNMLSSHVIDREKIIPNRSYAYTYENGIYKNFNNRDKNIVGQFGVEVSIFDLIKFDYALYTNIFLDEAHKQLLFKYGFKQKQQLLYVQSKHNCCNSIIIHDCVNKYTLSMLTNFIPTSNKNDELYEYMSILLQQFIRDPTILSFANRVDLLIQNEIKQKLTPGCAIGIFKNGKPIFKRGYGFSDVENNVPMTSSSVFFLGSLGKIFTAVGALILMQDGKIKLDDFVYKYIPDIPWKTMKIIHLIGHTSGLDDYQDYISFTKHFTENEILQIMYKMPLLFQPGEKFRYVNSGYVILSIIISRISGQEYGEFCRERIFEPCGMKDARVIRDKNIVKNRAKGYEINSKKELINQQLASDEIQSYGDVSFEMSINDFMMWDKSLYKQTVLNSKSIDIMLTPIRLDNGELINHRQVNYCYGLWQEHVDSLKLYHHFGSWRGTDGHFWHIPEKKLTIVMFANLAFYNTYYLSKSILELYIDKSINDNVLRFLHDTHNE